MAEQTPKLNGLIDAHEASGILRTYDGFSAQIVGKPGFKTFAVRRASISQTRLGHPDRDFSRSFARLGRGSSDLSKLSAASIGGMLNAMDVFTQKVLGHNAVADQPDPSVSLEEICGLAGLGDMEELEPSSQ